MNGRSKEQLVAEAITQPQVLAAHTILHLNPQLEQLDLTTLIAEIKGQCKQASAGDLSKIEGMLVAQSLTLDALFNKLIARAMANSEAGYLNATETYLRLALRAQSQARATGESLGALKNPPGVAFVRQANIAHGPQQVNNVQKPAALSASHARETENPPSKLLEQTNGERLEFGAKGSTSAVHTTLETVAAVNGTKNDRR
jgi:hypothetical protein